jgi:hypothetical protein
MRSKWDKNRTLGKSIEEREEAAKRAEVIADFSQHCRALRENPATHLVDFSER